MQSTLIINVGTHRHPLIQSISPLPLFSTNVEQPLNRPVPTHPLPPRQQPPPLPILSFQSRHTPSYKVRSSSHPLPQPDLSPPFPRRAQPPPPSPTTSPPSSTSPTSPTPSPTRQQTPNNLPLPPSVPPFPSVPSITHNCQPQAGANHRSTPAVQHHNNMPPPDKPSPATPPPNPPLTNTATPSPLHSSPQPSFPPPPQPPPLPPTPAPNTQLLSHNLPITPTSPTTSALIPASAARSNKRKALNAPLQPQPTNTVLVSHITRPASRTKRQRLPANKKGIPLHTPPPSTSQTSLPTPPILPPGLQTASLPAQSTHSEAAMKTALENFSEDDILSCVPPAPSAAEILDLDLKAIFEQEPSTANQSGPLETTIPMNAISDEEVQFDWGDIIPPSEIFPTLPIPSPSPTPPPPKSTSNNAAENTTVSIDSLCPAVALDQFATHSDLEDNNFVSNGINHVLGFDPTNSPDHIDIHDRKLDESELELDFQSSDLYESVFQLSESVDCKGYPCTDVGSRNDQDRDDGGCEPQQIVQSDKNDDSELAAVVEKSNLMGDIIQGGLQSTSAGGPFRVGNEEEKNIDALRGEIADSALCEANAAAILECVLSTEEGINGGGKVRGSGRQPSLQMMSIDAAQEIDPNIIQRSTETHATPSINQTLETEPIIASQIPFLGEAGSNGPQMVMDVGVSDSQKGTEDIDPECAPLSTEGNRMVDELLDFVERLDCEDTTQDGSGDNEDDALALPQDMEVTRLSSGETTADISRFEHVENQTVEMLQDITKDAPLTLPGNGTLQVLDPEGQIPLHDIYTTTDLPSHIVGKYKQAIGHDETEVTLNPLNPFFPTDPNGEDLHTGRNILEELTSRIGNGGNEPNRSFATAQGLEQKASQSLQNELHITTSKKAAKAMNPGISPAHAPLHLSKPGEVPAVDKAFATKKRHELVAKRSLKRAARQAMRNGTVVPGSALDSGSSTLDRSAKVGTYTPATGTQTPKGNNTGSASALTAMMNQHGGSQARTIGSAKAASAVCTIPTDRGELSVGSGKVGKSGSRRGGGVRNVRDDTKCAQQNIVHRHFTRIRNTDFKRSNPRQMVPPSNHALHGTNHHIKRCTTPGQPAHAHLSIEERRQIRAQRNRESAEKSRVRRKQATAELERSVASLRSESTWRGTRCQRMERLLRDIISVIDVSKGKGGRVQVGSNCAHAAMAQKLHDCVGLLDSVKTQCPRTFRQMTKMTNVKFATMEEV